MYLQEIDINKLQYPDSFHNTLSVFHQKDFLKIYSPYIHIIGIFNDNNELKGIFYYFKKSKLGITYIIPPPFHPNNGLIFQNEAQSTHKKISNDKELQELISDYFLKKEKADYIRFVLPAEFIDTQVFQWNKWKVKVHYTYQINLNQSIENLFNNLSSEKRKSIRKAEKDKVKITEERNYEIIKQLIHKTFKRQNKQFNTTYLDKIFNDWANDTNSFGFVAYYNNAPIATAFFVFDNSHCYYLIGGYDNEKSHHGAGVSCMWNGILKSKMLGLKVFDFSGSMLPPVEKYIRDFGGQLVPYYVCEKTKWFLYSK